ncbi:hypothetical protein EVAR_54768_1 [Eumeta japonica]|uniref:Uncharacterized protein n=1 Tax=Eumeta variegata TaxID=151549 RepID=A0A4C1YE57_EUMVA|nr:hypothetical protein EVAR_54768_1 [Eumeta japonica]
MRSTISTMLPSAGARHMVAAPGGKHRFDVHLRQRSGVDDVSASSSRVWRTSSRGSSLNVAANAVLIDRTNAPQAPPSGAPGGMNFKLWCGRRLFLHLLVYLLYVHQFFVCADEIRAVVRIHHSRVPLRAMNRRKASIMESDDKDSASSICTARVVRHVNSAPYLFFRHAAYRHLRPEIIDPVHVKGTLAVLRSNRVQLENRLTFGTTCESSLLTSVNVVRISPPRRSFALNSFLRPFVFAQEIGSVEPSVRFIKVGRRVSCRVISDVQFRRHPPPTFHRRCVPQFGQTMSDKRFERPWVGADPR